MVVMSIIYIHTVHLTALCIQVYACVSALIGVVRTTFNIHLPHKFIIDIKSIGLLVQFSLIKKNFANDLI